MVGPGQPDKTSGPPGPVSFTKRPARPERIFCWAGLGWAGPGRAGLGRAIGPGGPFRALLHTQRCRCVLERYNLLYGLLALG
jgi:hypothetical protein